MFQVEYKLDNQSTLYREDSTCFKITESFLHTLYGDRVEIIRVIHFT